MNAADPSTVTARMAAATIGFAGIIHILIAPSHWQHAPAHGIFFLGAGLIELGWAVAFLHRPSHALSYFGIGMMALLLLLWVLARALPAPFGHGPETIDAWSIVCKLSEVTGAVALGAFVMLGFEGNSSKRAAVQTITLAFLAGLALGALTYAGARAAAPYLPALAAVEAADHHHEEADDHEDAGAPDSNHEH